MGKSNKKSATKVTAPPVTVPKSGRKGKRGGGNKIEKAVSAKKQKLERDEAVLAKQKADKVQPKKPTISSPDDDSNDSDPGSEPKAKPASAVSNAARKAASSRDSSESDGDLSMEEVQASNKSDSPDESSDEDEGDEEKEQTSPKKKDTGVAMVDAGKSSASTFQKTPKTPATPEAIVSKTLYVGNLSFSVEESDVRAFFKNAGEMVDVRFSINAKGKFRGFGHVEFATVEAAQKAMELKDQELLGRPVRLGYAPERPDFTPKLRAHTASVRGFNTSLGEDEIRIALQKHFESCGEITRISFSPDYESGGVKKMAYMDFVYRSGLEAALQKNKSDLGGSFFLNVQDAKSKGDNAGGKSGGGRGGRDGGRSSDKGGREGGRGGRFSGRGGRGKKKKTFWDD